MAESAVCIIMILCIIYTLLGAWNVWGSPGFELPPECLRPLRSGLMLFNAGSVQSEVYRG